MVSSRRTSYRRTLSRLAGQIAEAARQHVAVLQPQQTGLQMAGNLSRAPRRMPPMLLIATFGVLLGSQGLFRHLAIVHALFFLPALCWSLTSWLWQWSQCAIPAWFAVMECVEYRVHVSRRCSSWCTRGVDRGASFPRRPPSVVAWRASSREEPIANAISADSDARYRSAPPSSSSMPWRLAAYGLSAVRGMPRRRKGLPAARRAILLRHHRRLRPGWLCPRRLSHGRIRSPSCCWRCSAVRSAPGRRAAIVIMSKRRMTAR